VVLLAVHQFHRDPFVVSQAIRLGMRMVTPAPAIARYPASIRW
jgi:PIN domain nuclease of toxin-antitoxin system